MKRFFKVAMVTVLYMGLTLTNCGFTDNTSAATPDTTTPGTTGQSDSPKAATGDKKTIYFVSLKVGGVTWSQAQQGFEDAYRELGWDSCCVIPTTANDPSQMANLCETVMTSDADAVLGPSFDKDVFIDIIERAHKQGILVGTISTYLDSIEDFNIGIDQENMGVIQTETLIGSAGDNPYEMVWTTINISNASIMGTYGAFCQALEGHNNISIHGIELDGSSPTTAADKMNNLWKANPAISAVVCSDSLGTSLGISNFIEESNLRGEFYSIGIDASADILSYVMIGGLDCTLDQNFYKMGYKDVYMLKGIWDSREAEKKVGSGMNRTTSTGVVEYGASHDYEVTATAK